MGDWARPFSADEGGGRPTTASSGSFFRAALPTSPPPCPPPGPDHAARLKARRALPIWDVHAEVMDAVRGFRVTVIAGETGCGKSTQVPQFLLSDPEVGRGCRIVVTQVRCRNACGAWWLW